MIVFIVIAVMFVPAVWGLWREFHKQRGIADLDALSDDWKPWNAVDAATHIIQEARRTK